MARVSLVLCSAVLLALALAGPASAWSKPQRLSPALGNGVNRFFSVSSPAVAVEPGGEAVVAWGGSPHGPPPPGAAGELRVAVGRGGRFHAPQRLGRGDDPVVAIGPGGTAVVAWTARPGTVMAALRRPGRRFGRPVALARGTNLAFGVRVAVAHDGAVAVVWHQWGSGRPLRDTAFAAFGSGLRLGRGVALATATRIDTLDVAFDATGTAVLAWVQQEQIAQPATVSVSRRPAGGAVTPPREVHRGLAYGAQLALEPGGRAGLAWIANYGPESGTFGPIQTALEQPGGAFEAPVVAPAASRARTFAARAAFGRDQELLALWQERSTGTTIDPGGPLLWSTRSAGAAFGPRVVLATGTVFDPALSPSGDGDAVAAWSDPRLRMARYRSRSGWRALSPPPGVPRRLRGALPTRAIAAAGRQVVVVWREAHARVVASARSL